MSPQSVGLALIAALLHAGWNALVRDSGDPLLGVWSIIVVAAIGSLLVLPFIGLPQGEIGLLLVASVLLHVGYDVSMANAYRIADLSVVYPVARGAASLLAGIGGVVLLSDVLTPAMMVGIGLAVAGLLVLSASRIEPRGALTALGAAAVLASFTLVDSAGTRIVGSSPQFVAALFPLHAAVETVGRAPATTASRAGGLCGHAAEAGADLGRGSTPVVPLCSRRDRAGTGRGRDRPAGDFRRDGHAPGCVAPGRARLVATLGRGVPDRGSGDGPGNRMTVAPCRSGERTARVDRCTPGQADQPPGRGDDTPFGLNLFVMKGVVVGKVAMREANASPLPYLGSEIAVMALLIAVPAIPTLLTEMALG